MAGFPNNKFFRRLTIVSSLLYIYITTAYVLIYEPQLTEWTVKLVLGGNTIFAAVIGFYHRNREADDKRADILWARKNDKT